jgi:hypothetical protein
MSVTELEPIAPPDPITEEVDANGVAIRRINELSENAYRSRPEWSISQAKILPEEPELFWGRYIAKLADYQMKPSPAMNIGTAVHESLLQNIPLRVIPASVLSSSGAKQGNKWKEFAEEHKGEAWLKEDEAEPIKRCIDSVMNDRKARALLELPGDCELAIFRRDEWTGLRRRHRLDKLIRVGNGIVLDLKTAADPTDYGFPFACLDHKYHVQAADYMEAAEAALGGVPEAFIFIAVQPAAPYICQVYTSRPSMLELGYMRLRECLNDLKARLDTGDWYRAGHGNLQVLDLPKKAYA